MAKKNLEKKAIEFVSYDGSYLNFYYGNLVVKIDDKEVSL